MARDSTAQLAEGVSPFRIRNVQLSFYITVTMLTIWSFSFGATFDAYLLELAREQGRSKPNEFVGSVETVRGMVALVLALPLGVLSDKMNRRRLLRWCSGAGTVGVVCLCFGILYDLVWLMYCGVVISAIFMQVYMTCGQALLTDSVPRSQLTEVVTMQGTLFLLGYSVGPLAQMALIAVVGDTWHLKELHIFLCVGFCLWPLVVPAFFLFERTPAEREAALSESLVSAGASEASNGGASAENPEAVADEVGNWREVKVLGLKKKWLVPLIVEFCSLIIALGAGMTVKFFPLFFKEDYHFQPMALCGLSAGYTVMIAIFVQLCRKLSTRVGRCQAALAWQVMGTVCLFALWKAESLPLVIFFYVVRGSFMNAAGPINQAIVMDCVESRYRGRWAALQSISRFSWSGSAILGGWLADSHDYRFTFFITGLIYATATVCYLPLLLLVPNEGPPAACPSGGARELAAAGTAKAAANPASPETASSTERPAGEGADS